MKQSEAATTADATPRIYLDIETWSGEKPDPTTIKAPANYKSPEAIEKYQLANADKEWRKQSLDPHKGEVFCIGIAVNDDDPFCIVGVDEEDTMRQLEKEVDGYGMFPKVYGHNIIEFDGYWLFLKGLKYDLPATISMFSEKRNLIDTMRIMDGSAFKKMTSQDKMAAALGIQGKGHITGGMVHDLIVNGMGDTVCEYCKSDVVTLRDCAKKLAKYGLR